MGEYVARILSFIEHKYILILSVIIGGWLAWKIWKDINNGKIKDVNKQLFDIRPLLVNAVSECVGNDLRLMLTNSGNLVTVAEILVLKGNLVPRDYSRRVEPGGKLQIILEQQPPTGKPVVCLGNDIRLEIKMTDALGNHYSQTAFNTGMDYFNSSLPVLLTPPEEVVLSSNEGEYKKA